MTPEQAAWLSDIRNPRTLLCEPQARQSDGILALHRWSTRAYQTKPSDAAQAAYEVVIADEPVIAASADNALDFGGVSVVNVGELDMVLRDDFAMQPVTLLLGDAGWARSSFLGVSLVADENGLQGNGADSLSLALRSPLTLLDHPVTTAKTANEKLVPVGFGTCFNIAPVFLGEDIDGAHYQVNDGPVDSLTVKSGGLPVALNMIDFDLANGIFSIDPPPSGEVTVDIVFQSADGVIDIIENLLIRSQIAYDSDNLDAWAQVCNQKAGIYIDSRQSYREAIDYVCESVGLRLGAFPDATVYLWRIAAPAPDSEVMNIGTGDMIVDGLKFARKIQPYAIVRIGYQRNWNPLEKTALYGTGEDLNFIDEMKREWTTVTVTDTVIDDEYPAAARMPDGEVTATALYLQSDAVAEANRRASTFGASVYEFTLEFVGDFIYRLGSSVNIFDTRFGFATGQLGQVVGIRWQPLAGISEITFWVWG
jgi:hypothetical protein